MKTKHSWTRETISVAFAVGHRQDVPAETCGGLAVHRSEVMGVWNVTHVASGIAVSIGFRTRHGARSFAEQILPLTDWTRSQDEVLRMPAEKRGKIVAAKKRWEDA